jgi:hypothetical protein
MLELAAKGCDNFPNELFFAVNVITFSNLSTCAGAVVNQKQANSNWYN